MFFPSQIKLIIPESKRQDPDSIISYRVLLGILGDNIPNKIMSYYMEIGGIKPVHNTDGTTSYYSTTYTSEEVCNSIIKDYAKRYGFKKMRIVVDTDGEIIPLK